MSGPWRGRSSTVTATSIGSVSFAASGAQPQTTTHVSVTSGRRILTERFTLAVILPWLPGPNRQNVRTGHTRLALCEGERSIVDGRPHARRGTPDCGAPPRRAATHWRHSGGGH